MQDAIVGVSEYDSFTVATDEIMTHETIGGKDTYVVGQTAARGSGYLTFVSLGACRH